MGINYAPLPSNFFYTPMSLFIQKLFKDKKVVKLTSHNISLGLD
jgi:hypothetical protein